MKWLKWCGGVVGGVIFLFAVVPLLVSLNDYIPQIERALSAMIQEPVKIGSVRVVGLPLPHVTVSDIAVGKTDDIKVGKITVTPDLMSLLDATKVIKSVAIEKVVLNQKALDKTPAWTRSESKGQAPIQLRVDRITLDDVLVKLDKASLGPFDARLNLTGSGDLEDASIASRDGKLKALVKPAGTSRFRIDVEARSWKLPAGPPILFDELSARGVVTLNGAVFDHVDARLYGGRMRGRTSIAWQRELLLKGNLDVNQVELRSLVPLLSPGASLSGKLSANPVFSASAKDARRLVSALQLETPFNVQNGVLYGVDIGGAATALISGESAKGVKTRFDTLSGHLKMDRGTYHVTQLNVKSGSLAADGNVTISPREELSGRINANVKAAKLASATVPLNVSGTVQRPILLPTRGTVAGAAAGTVILGPVLGTSVGAKVGQWTERLFGKKVDKK